MQPISRVLLRSQRAYCLLAGVLARTRALIKALSVWRCCAISVAVASIGPTPTIAAEAQTNRMTVEYVPPTNPAHQTLYQRLKERRVLEKL